MLSITFYGREILVDTKLELNCTRRYGLVGANGSGKSTLLAVVGNREVPVPDHIDIFLVRWIILYIDIMLLQDTCNTLNNLSPEIGRS